MRQLIRFDWAMKRLLRSKANFGILEGFLSELLKRDLKILSLLESESNKEDKDGKFNRVDILVELAGGEIVLIELQVNTESDYFYRMLFGASKIVVEHLKEGEPYSQIKKVYSVNILYFDLGHGEDYVYHGTTSFVGIHKNDQLDLNESQKKVYQKEYAYQIYPEYYLLKVTQFNDVAKDTLDEWIYFLKNEEIKDNFHAKGLIEAKEKLDSLKLDPKEKEEYDKYIKNLTYQKSVVLSNYEDGKIEGIEEGIVKGRMEGEKAKAIEIAKNLKKLGMDTIEIQRATGLSTNEILSKL